MSTDDGRLAQPPLRLGIAGLGLAGAFMIRAASVHPRIALRAGMDPLPRPREAFARQFGANVLCGLSRTMSRRVDRGDLHRIAPSLSCAAGHGSDGARQARGGRKAVGPDAGRMRRSVVAAERSGMQLIVGHTHAFDPNIREMHRIIQSGELGRLGMILRLQLQRFSVPATSCR